MYVFDYVVQIARRRFAQAASLEERTQDDRADEGRSKDTAKESDKQSVRHASNTHAGG